MTAPLPRALAVKARDSWHGGVVDCVVLDFDDRHRRRMRMRGVRGLDFLLDLSGATTLRGGDALVLETGGLVEVIASPEHLVEISSASAADMMRIAWHIGNRHLPVQLAGARLRIRRDHVIEAMIEGLGGRLRAIEAPFDPEGGAYADDGHGPHVHRGHGVARADHDHG